MIQNKGKAQVVANDIRLGADVIAAGPVYRVILTASSVTPVAELTSATRDNEGKGFFYLSKNFNQYPEGYLAMEVRIFAESPDNRFTYNKGLSDVANFEPLFTYNTAIVR